MEDIIEKTIEKLVQKWPSALVAREEAHHFSGGLVRPGTLANLDSRGQGPRGRMCIGRKTAYDARLLAEWIFSRKDFYQNSRKP